MSNFSDILNHFKEKEKENPECIVPLIEDSVLRNGLVAWRSVKTATEENGKCTELTEVGQWDWMWSTVKYDQRKFAQVAGVPEHEVQRLLNRLIGLRLIYPDGTVNTVAQDYLKALIVSKLPKLPKMPKDKSPKDKS